MLLSTNFCKKKVWRTMDYYILHSVSLIIILLFINTIICYHYAKHRSNQKKLSAVLTLYKMENELKKVRLWLVDNLFIAEHTQ